VPTWWGQLSVIAGVAPHGYSQHEVTESFIRFPGFEVFEDMVRKLFASSKVLELDFGVLLQLVQKGSHLADRLDETISRGAVRGPAPGSGSRVPQDAVLPDGGERVVGPFLVWSRHAGPKLGD
jgi:hypothetical protein